MTGCEACSALVNEGDTQCAICGADLAGGSVAGSRPQAPARRVHIPVRRYGKAPPPPRAWLSGRGDSTGFGVVAAALGATVLAVCLAAWWPFG